MALLAPVGMRDMETLVNLTAFMYFVANGIAMIVLPPYLDELGVGGEDVIGLIMSSAFAVSIAVRPLSGIMGERIGYVRLMRLGAGLAVLAQALYLGGTPLYVHLGRLVHGASIATFLPMSIAASIAGGPHAIASRSLAIGLGNIVGPILGSYMYDALGPAIPLSLGLALHLANAALLARAQYVGGRPTGGNGVGRVEARVYVFTALLSLFALTYMSYSTFIPLKLKDGELPISYWGIFTSAASASSLVPRAAMARMWVPGYRTAALSTSAVALGLSLSSTVDDPLLFAAAGALFGLGQGAMVVSYQVLALTRSRRPGLASSIYTMGWDVGSLVGPPIVGSAIVGAGYTVLTALPAILLVNIAILAVLGARKAVDGDG